MRLNRRDVLKSLACAPLCAISPPMFGLAPHPRIASGKGIAFTRSSYVIDGETADLYSGEIHYFRTPRAAWRERMLLLKAAGANCVATYIPWMFHEPQEGKFTFGTSALNDLSGFLEIASAVGLYVIARPGPYQYSELKYSGLPAWLFEKYPDIRARRADGRQFNYAESVSYLHPTFLAKTRGWFDAICPLIARYSVSKSGPIALTQIDNELTGIHLWFDGPDYHPVTMGFGKTDGRYVRFLESKFGSITALNADYGTHFEEFSAVPPIGMDPPPSNPVPLLEQQLTTQRRRQDYFDFYLETVAEYAALLAGWMRDHGIDTPLTLNSGPNMTPLLVPAIRAIGGNSLLGSDHYYTLDQTWAQNNPTPQFAAANFCSLESLRLLGFPPTVFELQGGSSADWPPITAKDAGTHYWMNIAFGMKGSNYYVFTGGPNPPGAGTTGDSYDYGAAVGGVSGEIRPLYRVEKDLGEFLQEHRWLALAEREYDCRVAYDFDYARSEYTFKDHGELPISDFEAFEFFRRGILTSALCASLSPCLCDLDSDEWITHAGTPVVIVSSSSMSRAKQLRIVSFLRNGGRALLAPVVPTLDERLHPCTVLASFLGFADIHTTVRDNGTYEMTPNAPPDGRWLTVSDPGNAPWLLEVSGGGRLIFLGKRWNHAMHTQAIMIRDLLNQLGLQQRVICSSPNLWTSLRTYEQHAVLFVINLFTSDIKAQVRCSIPGAAVVSVPIQSYPAMSVQHFVFNRGRRA